MKSARRPTRPLHGYFCLGSFNLRPTARDTGVNIGDDQRRQRRSGVGGCAYRVEFIVESDMYADHKA